MPGPAGGVPGIGVMRQFRPHPLLRGAHLQTLAGAFWPGPRTRDQSCLREVVLPDGDVLVMQDDQPPQWRDGDRCALLLHGLSGTASSSYVLRLALALQGAGVRTFRLNFRNAGAGFGRASQIYHAGRGPDVIEVLQWIGSHCPGSPVGLVAASLGASIALRMLGEVGAGAGSQLPMLERAAMISPPLDLQACVRTLDRGFNRLYDRHFTRNLMTLMRRHATHTGRDHADLPSPRTLYEFDETITAPAAGHPSAAAYYAAHSCAPLLGEIAIPTLILAAADDPIAPPSCVDQQSWPRVTLHVSRHGGHLGFVAGRRGDDPDRFWSVWRVRDFVVAGVTPTGESAG